MGAVRVTVQNLEVVSVDAEKNLILVKGAVPGPKKSLLKLDVKILQISAPVWERNLYMIHDRQAFMPPAVRNFCEFVLKECKYPMIPD